MSFIPRSSATEVRLSKNRGFAALIENFRANAASALLRGSPKITNFQFT